jgi:hypothetical protein
VPHYSSGHGFDEPFISVTGIVSFLLVVAALTVLAFSSVSYIRSHRSMGSQAPEPQTAPAPPMRVIPSP